MTEYFKQILTSQFEASLAMLNQCIEHCPQQHWEGKIASPPLDRLRLAMKSKSDLRI